jgi:hypothetical protein
VIGSQIGSTNITSRPIELCSYVLVVSKVLIGREEGVGRLAGKRYAHDAPNITAKYTVTHKGIKLGDNTPILSTKDHSP